MALADLNEGAESRCSCWRLGLCPSSFDIQFLQPWHPLSLRRQWKGLAMKAATRLRKKPRSEQETKAARKLIERVFTVDQPIL
jgi:hypothetical protein